MSLSAKDSSQDNNVSQTNRPASNDMLESEDWSVSKEHTSASEDDSLVEHILDFLDKYPSCFVTQVPSLNVRQGMLSAC